MQETISDIGRVYLRWALTDGVGPLTFTRMLNAFDGAEAALSASADALMTIPGVGTRKAAAIVQSRTETDIEAEIAAASAHGVRIICRADPAYPQGLKYIPDAPIVLYVKGELRPTDAIAVAIVGSRRCTIYGSEQARRFGELLAGAGFTVVSGLARGIDAFAHHGAVDSGGRSIAVMGRGLTEVYPPDNRALAEKLLERGAWVSELPMQAAVHAENFPGRNRIIAGMTLGTIVVEAGHRSGALITARHAAEYNREVFAVPGRVQDPMSIGTNALIRDSGAKLVTCLEDVLSELGDVGRRMGLLVSAAAASDEAAGESGSSARAASEGLFDSAEGGSRAAPTADTSGPSCDAPGVAGTRGSQRPGSVYLSRAERAVLDLIGVEPILQDIIMQASGLPPGEVLATLTTLELKGCIRRLPGNLVVRRGVA